ncbi:MAG: hypothetical protein AB2551_03965 [Candidatus Thiodiazotropha sp.]
MAGRETFHLLPNVKITAQVVGAELQEKSKSWPTGSTEIGGELLFYAKTIEELLIGNINSDPRHLSVKSYRLSNLALNLLALDA